MVDCTKHGPTEGMLRQPTACKECHREKGRQRYAEQRERLKAINSDWQNKNRSAWYVSIRAWKERNKHRVMEATRFRQAQKRNATPPWLTKAHREEMAETYRQAQALGLWVDHVIPLVGKTVCGLHVPWNLQLLTPKENMKKGIKYG